MVSQLNRQMSTALSSALLSAVVIRAMLDFLRRFKREIDRFCNSGLRGSHTATLKNSIFVILTLYELVYITARSLL